MNYRAIWEQSANGDFGNEQFYTDISLDLTLALKNMTPFSSAPLRVVRKESQRARS
jgi:hypothetical protein